MATAIHIEADRNARLLAQTEYVRLEIMVNGAMWDAELTDEEKPIILRYLNRKKEQAAKLMNHGVLCEPIK